MDDGHGSRKLFSFDPMMSFTMSVKDFPKCWLRCKADMIDTEPTGLSIVSVARISLAGSSQSNMASMSDRQELSFSPNRALKVGS